MILQIYINEYKHVPNEEIYCWLTESNYGGYITDKWDQRILNTVLSDFCNRNVIEIPNYSFHHEHKVPMRFDYRDFISTIEVKTFFLILLCRNSFEFCYIFTIYLLWQFILKVLNDIQKHIT